MEFDAFIEEFERECEADVVSWLADVGRSAYEQAQSQRAFQDQTGNLMASIGWAVIKDGRVVEQGGFQGAEQGSATGLALVDEAKSSEGYELIFVAGMHYATFVEAKGYDVNTAGELLIDELMRLWLV